MHRSSSFGRAFEKLKEVEFLVDDPLLYKAISKTFDPRKRKALPLHFITQLAQTERIEGTRLNRGDDFYVAKRSWKSFRMSRSMDY